MARTRPLAPTCKLDACFSLALTQKYSSCVLAVSCRARCRRISTPFEAMVEFPVFEVINFSTS